MLNSNLKKKLLRKSFVLDKVPCSKFTFEIYEPDYGTSLVLVFGISDDENEYIVFPTIEAALSFIQFNFQL